MTPRVLRADGTARRQVRLRAPKLPLTVRLLRLYPQAWRDRYGKELAELLVREPVSLLATLSVVGGALDAHLHRHLPTAGGVPGMPRTRERLRTAAITVFCAYIGCVVAALAFFEAVNDLSFAPLMHAYPELTVPWTTLAVGAVVALLAVLVGGLPILLAVLREARARRRRDLRLFAVPPLALMVLCGCDVLEEGLRRERIALPPALGLTLDVGFHALFVLAVVACAVAVCIAVVRSAISGRLFRFALAPAAVATLAMGVMLGASVVWLARASADAPDRFGTSPIGLGFALLVALMVGATALAASAVARGLAVRAPGDTGDLGPRLSA